MAAEPARKREPLTASWRGGYQRYIRTLNLTINPADSTAVRGNPSFYTLSSIAIGERCDTAVHAGFAMAQVGPVFAYLIAAVAQSGGAARTFLCSLAIAVSTITAFLSPFLIRKSDSAAKWLDRHISAPVRGAIDR